MVPVLKNEQDDRKRYQEKSLKLFSLYHDETEVITMPGDSVDSDSISLDSRDDKKMESLSFGGTFKYTSKQFSLPMEKFEENLYNFLHDESIQHEILSGGKNSTIKCITEEELTQDIISTWNDQVKLLGVEEADPSNDSVVVLTPPGIELVTVKVIPTTTIGTKLFTRAQGDNNNMHIPEFQGILIADEPRAVGPKFFVWLFNKIAHGGNPDDEVINNNKNSSNRRESALLKVYVDSIEINDDVVKFSFIAESFMRLEFDFPKLLLRFFPMKKDTAEKLCSDAIVKALETNMLPAMEGFCDSFEKSYPQ